MTSNLRFTVEFENRFTLQRRTAVVELVRAYQPGDTRRDARSLRTVRPGGVGARLQACRRQNARRVRRPARKPCRRSGCNDVRRAGDIRRRPAAILGSRRSPMRSTKHCAPATSRPTAIRTPRLCSRRSPGLPVTGAAASPSGFWRSTSWSTMTAGKSNCMRSPVGWNENRGAILARCGRAGCWRLRIGPPALEPAARPSCHQGKG